mmetsp:Transcript_134226/g.233049  ORF Transcript_134226/g.233049 Transcript_134226/m.233049 type:complete len:80 (-) Transcript_134226:655-894(-)
MTACQHNNQKCVSGGHAPIPAKTSIFLHVCLLAKDINPHNHLVPTALSKPMEASVDYLQMIPNQIIYLKDKHSPSGYLG